MTPSRPNPVRANILSQVRAWPIGALRFCVLALAIYSFAESTADPDLWGHVLFGQRMLALGGVEKVEPFSWTAPGAPWVNHEVLAEVALGKAHRLAGGAGLLALKVLVGLLTFGLALRLGSRQLAASDKPLAWALGGLCVVEIAFGFAARPQIFTALALAILLWILTRVTEGARRWAWLLPPLFLIWFNTHGGALAGLVLVLAASVALALEWVWRLIRSRHNTARKGASAAALALAGIGAGLTAFCNPWGPAAVGWLIRSVAWSRPTIEEWNPPPFGWDHAPLFALMALAVFALTLAPRGRRGPLWSWMALALLGVAAMRYVRHTPLFAVAALAFLPLPLTAAWHRLAQRGRAASLARLAASTTARVIAAALLGLAAVAMLAATPRHANRLTMQVPHNQYPLAAIAFMRQNGLEGRLLAWFDWGELCLWELPACPVSIDGRLDTCYPMPLIAAHWRFYAGSVETGPDLDVRNADLALLPTGLKGFLALKRMGGWQPVYADALAELWVRQPDRFPALRARILPVKGVKEDVLGRTAFPDALPIRARL